MPRTLLKYVCCLSTLFSSYHDVNIADECLQLIVYNCVLCNVPEGQNILEEPQNLDYCYAIPSLSEQC